MFLPIRHSETVCRLCGFLLLLFAAAFGSASTNSGQIDSLPQNNPTNSWNGLVPLRSSRTDVEKLLGQPKMSHGSTSIYEKEKQRVNVRYSKGSCQIGGEVWSVAKDIVIRIEVVPQKSILVGDLHLDPEKYDRIPWSHPDNWVEYRNTDEGIVVRTIAWRDKVEELYLTEYIPTRKDSLLRCKPPARVTNGP